MGERSQDGGDDAEKKVGSVVCAGDRTRGLLGVYKFLYVGGDGRSNGVRIIVPEEISKQDSGHCGKMGGTDSYGIGGCAEANGLCYVSIWATDGKDWGREAKIQGRC